MLSLWKIWLQRKDWSLSRMMIECSIVVLLLQDLSYKKSRFGCVHYSLYSQVITFSKSIMWSGGNNKSHAPVDLQEVGFRWPNAHCDAATDGWLNNEKVDKDTPRCASKSEVVHIPGRFCYSWMWSRFWSAYYSWEATPWYDRALVDMENR